VHDELRAYLREIQDLDCAPLLELLVGRVADLDPDLESEVGAFGVRFARSGVTLCEFSVFGELFIARVGRDHAVEYRVRSRDVALEALDHVLRESIAMRDALAAP
jgi:hypothetical protein